MCDVTSDLKRLISKEAVSSSSSSKRTAVRSPFYDAAIEIGRGIERTTTLVTKLNKVVNQQGLFDDPVEEINGLCFRIKQDIDALNKKCDDAQTYVDHKREEMGMGSQLAQHTNSMVSNLKMSLLSVTKEFKSTLETRSTKMKDQQQRKVKLTGNSALSPSKMARAAASGGDTRGSSGGGERLPRPGANFDSAPRGPPPAPGRPFGLPNPYEQPLRSGVPQALTNRQDEADEERNGNSSPMHSGGYSQNHNLGGTLGAQEQRLLLAPPTQSRYYEEREGAVQEVERTIVELGSLFQRLTSMIHEQQDLVERIDEDVEAAVGTTEAGREQLTKAYESQTSGKTLYWKLGGIATIFTVFFTVFLL